MALNKPLAKLVALQPLSAIPPQWRAGFGGTPQWHGHMAPVAPGLQPVAIPSAASSGILTQETLSAIEFGNTDPKGYVCNATRDAR